MTMNQTLDGAELVRFLFERFAAGDIAAMVSRWRDDARWHPVTKAGIDGFDEPRGRDDYFGEILPTAFSLLSDYTYEVTAVESFGALVVAHVRSSWARGDRREHAEGLMIFRLDDGLVADLYVINAAGAGVF
jgi:ketosteroid isomerase-like protein